ncbi:unnamed protein product [Gordionus sp. m RMFG-2023]
MSASSYKNFMPFYDKGRSQSYVENSVNFKLQQDLNDKNKRYGRDDNEDRKSEDGKYNPHKFVNYDPPSKSHKISLPIKLKRGRKPYQFPQLINSHPKKHPDTYHKIEERTNKPMTYKKLKVISNKDKADESYTGNTNKIVEPSQDEIACRQTFRNQLVNSQIEVCKNHPESLTCVTQGARMALTECQQQFRNERWNCSTAAIEKRIESDLEEKDENYFDKIYQAPVLEGRRNVPSKGVKKRIRRVGLRHPHFYLQSEQNAVFNDNYQNINFPLYDNEANIKIINILSKTLEKGTKESAFIYAAASAAVVHAVTQSCSSGNLTDCTCKTLSKNEENTFDLRDDDELMGKSEWKWGGCSDNIDYGIQFSKEFVDAPDRDQLKMLLKYFGPSVIDSDKSKAIKFQSFKNLSQSILISNSNDYKVFRISINESTPIFTFPYKRPNKLIVRHMVNLHNNQMGRKVIKDMIRKQCRCHGVSGSCELKTCWLNMSPFSIIGAHIKNKYRESVRVAPKLMITNRISRSLNYLLPMNNEENVIIPNEIDIDSNILSLRRKPKSECELPIKENELVHLDKSPNYCDPDPHSGIFGTRGRECNLTSTGTDNCDNICCGRGHLEESIIKSERCHCKFVWCCYVKCQTCTSIETRYICK